PHVKEHLLYVTDPSSPAVHPAGQVAGWCNPHLVANYLGDPHHVHLVFRAHVVHGDPIGPADDPEQGIDAIVDVEVRLRLSSVTQDLKPLRVPLQFRDEIRNYPVPTPWSDDVCQPQDVGVEPAHLRVARDERLRAQLGGAVDRYRYERRVVFVCRAQFRVAVNGRGGRIHKMGDSTLTGGLQDDLRG